MTSSFTDLSDSKSHPINLLEKIIISKNWVFERPIEDEIYIEVPTKYSNLIIQVTWLKNQSRIEIRTFFYNKMDFSDNIEQIFIIRPYLCLIIFFDTACVIKNGAFKFTFIS